MSEKAVQEQKAQTEQRVLARSSTSVGLCTLSSRILGFVRDSLMAAVLGVGPVGGAVVFACLLPNFFRRIFGEGAFTAVFLPTYTRTLEGQGTAAASRLVSVVSGMLIVVLGIIAILAIAFSWVVPTEWFRNWETAEQALYTLNYLPIVFPFVILVCAYAMAMAVLNAHRIFVLPALSPSVQNVVAIVGVALAAVLYSAEELPQAGTLISWFFLFSGVVMLVMLFPALKKIHMLTPPTIAPKHPAVKQIGREMLPLVLGLGLVQINLVVDQGIAWHFLGEGSNQYVHLGSRLLQFPIGIIGIGTATVTFPMFARHFAAGTLKILRHEFDQAFRWISFLALPAAAGLVVLASPIVQVLFEHGKFTSADTAETSRAVMMYALGIPALCVIPVVARVFYAAGNARTPVRIAAVLVGVNVVLSLAFVQWMDSAGGIALATSVTGWLNLLFLLRAFSRLDLPSSSERFMGMGRMGLAALLACAAAWACYAALYPLGALAALLGGVIFGAGAYFFTAALLRIPELQSLRQMLFKK